MGYRRANLATIREAVLRRRVVKFIHKGEPILGEPHLFGQAVRTGSFYLKVWDLGASSWRYFPFCEIKDFVSLPDIFAIRPDVLDTERKITVYDTIARLR